MIKIYVDISCSSPYGRPVGVTRTTISLDPQLHEKAVKRAAALGYRKFSHYIEFLMDRDVKERPPHVSVREEPTAPTAPPKKKSGGTSY
jgi:hypothetical protein